MRYLALATVLASLAGVSASGAQETLPSATVPPKAVIELFTSQGCSSCPAADSLFSQYAARDDVVALSMSVDYWDYLGWKDTLASPKYSQRQRHYAESRRDGMVYTPQIVVNGVVHVNGSDRAKIEHAIEKTSPTGLRVPIRMFGEKGKLVIETGATPQGTEPKDATLWLAVVARKVEVPIKRGENQGKTITYYNVVRELTPVGMWSGKPMTVHLERHSFMLPGTERCAVLLQQGKAGPIIGAAMLRQF